MNEVPVPIDTACTLEDVRYILQDCRAQVLVTDRSWLERLGTSFVPKGSANESPFLQHVLPIDGDRSLISLLNQQDEQIDWVQTDRATIRD
jgi:acyl-CoA synthetase (AMP-forming)/AMP-acid ligase II